MQRGYPADRQHNRAALVNDPQAFGKLCKSWGTIYPQVSRELKDKGIALNSIAGRAYKSYRIGELRKEVSMPRDLTAPAAVGDALYAQGGENQLRSGFSPSIVVLTGACPDRTGTSSTPSWVRVLDRQKDPPQGGLHPDRCKARVGRDGGGVCRGWLWRVSGTEGFGLSSAWDEVGMHRYEFWRGDA